MGGGIVQPRQFAIKVSGGAEIVKHTNQSLFDGAKNNNAHKCFIQVDIKNAFGVPYRNQMYKIIKEYVPELCGIFISSYGNSSFLYKSRKRTKKMLLLLFKFSSFKIKYTLNHLPPIRTANTCIHCSLLVYIHETLNFVTTFMDVSSIK